MQRSETPIKRKGIPLEILRLPMGLAKQRIGQLASHMRLWEALAMIPVQLLSSPVLLKGFDPKNWLYAKLREFGEAGRSNMYHSANNPVSRS
jgi:hypothetical protein